jgi:hypothetical protein
VYQTIDAIDTFKVQALDSMQTTINSLDSEIARAQSYLARAHGAEQPGPVSGGELHLPDAT